ncbi:MAG TPA: RagB/SusD family nutrient uptake outer membrane protein, partial [Anseongella sp.]|nr:RagB/SusD family nutrient uptake outer membrane protein [Anseongella sp.]
MKKILIAALLAFSLQGCNDYLDERNRTDVLAEELYTTASGFENLVSATYSTLRNVYSSPWIFMSGTDMYVNGRGNGPTGLTSYKTLSPAEPEVGDFYRTCYDAIQLCNVGVHYSDITEQTSSVPARKGEMKFLRAYYYFLMVQSFGGVPLVTEAFTAPQTSFERASAEAVYEFILAEMNEALSLVEDNPALGRVSKAAVRHYLAKVHLTRGYEPFAAGDDFEKAAQFADQATNGYDLSSLSFNDLFWPGNDQNSEVLFSVQYDEASLDLEDDSPGSIQSAYFGPYHGGEGLQQGYPYRTYALIATSYVYDLFTENDLRWEGSFMNQVYERYYDFYDVTDPSNLVVRRYFPQSWEVADTAAWRAADPARRSGTEILPYELIQVNPIVNRWEQPVQYFDNMVPDVRKFDDPRPGVFGEGTSVRDIFLARLAETYLIAAEAYFKTGDLSNAMLRINEVKQRAERNPGDLVLSSPSQVTLNEILDERARELIG